ncbi:MAG: Fe-S cluster assembly protein SufD [Methylococcaceae bacterium]
MASHYSTEYEQIVDSLPGESLTWLKALRADAFDSFSDKGFPSLREEEWRYTNVAAIEKKLFSPQLEIGTNDIDKEWLTNYSLKDAYTVVLVNGRLSLEYSTLDGLPDNVCVLGLADALEKQPELVEKYLTQAVSNNEHSFVAFNTAWFSDGLFVHIPAKQIVDKPIQLLHFVTQADLLATTRNILVVDEMAEVSIIETYVGIDDAYLSAAVSEVFVGKNAELNLYKVQSEGEKAYHFGGTYVKQERDSRFNHHNFAFGGLLARNDIHTDLDIASECNLNGLFLGAKRQHIDNHTRIIHSQPHAISRELYKGILNQRARGVFQGRVIVAEDAQKTDSEMNNNNLLLSNDAEVDTKPQLEIYADDVKCGHGVTVGQLDEKSIFYMQSRCVDEETARNILTFAFANEMVDKVTIESLREKLLEQLLERFPQAGIEKSWL